MRITDPPRAARRHKASFAPWDRARATPSGSTGSLQGLVSVRIRSDQLLIVPRFQARVLVRLRPSVLDPAGEAARGAAERLGVEGLSKLRIGKAVEMELEAPDEAEARRRMELLSDRLLANPVIEDWSLELQQS